MAAYFAFPAGTVTFERRTVLCFFLWLFLSWELPYVYLVPFVAAGFTAIAAYVRGFDAIKKQTHGDRFGMPGPFTNGRECVGQAMEFMSNHMTRSEFLESSPENRAHFNAWCAGNNEFPNGGWQFDMPADAQMPEDQLLLVIEKFQSYVWGSAHRMIEAASSIDALQKQLSRVSTQLNMWASAGSKMGLQAATSTEQILAAMKAYGAFTDHSLFVQEIYGAASNLPGWIPRPELPANTDTAGLHAWIRGWMIDLGKTAEPVAAPVAVPISEPYDNSAEMARINELEGSLAAANAQLLAATNANNAARMANESLAAQLAAVGNRMGGGSPALARRKVWQAPMFDECFSGQPCDWRKWKRSCVRWVSTNQPALGTSSNALVWLSCLLPAGPHMFVEQSMDDLASKEPSVLAAVTKMVSWLDPFFEDPEAITRERTNWERSKQGAESFTTWFLKWQTSATELRIPEEERQRRFLEALRPGIKQRLQIRYDVTAMPSYQELVPECLMFDRMCGDDVCHPIPACPKPAPFKCPKGLGEAYPCNKGSSAAVAPAVSAPRSAARSSSSSAPAKCSECKWSRGHKPSCSLRRSSRSAAAHAGHHRIQDNHLFGTIIKALKELKAIDPDSSARSEWCRRRGICPDCIQRMPSPAAAQQFNNYVAQQDADLAAGIARANAQR